MSKINKIIIAFCLLVVIVVLVYATFILKLPWSNIVMPMILSFIISVITSLIINKKERRQEPNSTLPYNASDKASDGSLIDMKPEVIPVKREMNSAMKSYIEVLIKGDEIDIWNLEPGVCEKMYLGDKIIIDRNRVREPSFMQDFFSESTRRKFIEQENRYFGTSNLCFVQVTEKIYHGNKIELHGAIVGKDGVFYSD